jgi:hypothetical protein
MTKKSDKTANAAQVARRVADPLVEAKIQRALKPYLGVAPPSLLQTMRETLEDALTTHPVAVGLLDRARKRPEPDRSGDVPKGGGHDGGDA